ncbi:MAG: ATP-binding cassette domain-containing protein [Firmicutes bacterium]|nr:ATP-binding cassette domain-containing protein [Bacillota bacterium]
MQPVIKLSNVDLIYRSAESLSYKKMLMSLIKKGSDLVLKHYKALNNVSVTMEKGKVYGIIGSNGAGKSTLLRVMSGVMSPNSGVVERNYQTINLLALGVGFLKELPGIDNIYLNGMLLGFSRKHIASVVQDIIAYSEIGEFIKRPMKTYSSGMVSRLGFAIAIHLKPEVLLIDETLSVGDAKFSAKSFASIQQIISDQDITVAIVSHSEALIQQFCDKVIWLDKGCIIEQGDTKSILDLYKQFNANAIKLQSMERPG